MGVDDVAALVEFRLAPLAVRCDIAMLGMIHRAAVGEGPTHFKKFFKPSGCSGSHRRQLEEPRSALAHLVVKRSAFGLVAVYNKLPPAVVEPRCISAFQRNLQNLVLERATAGYGDLTALLCPRRVVVHR